MAEFEIHFNLKMTSSLLHVETWTLHFKSSMLTKHQGWHHPYNEFSSLLLVLCEMRATSVSLQSLAYKYP